jgi:predicted nucleic acid-binding protein
MDNLNNLNLQDAIFLDETALAAFMNARDPHYVKARSLFLDMHDLDRHFVTTNSIIFFIHEWLRNAYDYPHAEFFLNAIDKAANKGKLAIIPGGPEFEAESRRLLIDRPELLFSLSEAYTSVVMSFYQIKRIFTFNRNFVMLISLDKDIKIIPSF